MNKNTELLLYTLDKSQVELRGALDSPSTPCPINDKYTAEWEHLSNYLDIAVENMRAYVAEGNELPPEETAAFLGFISSLTSALLRGNMEDLSDCPACTRNCPLNTRAKAALFVLSVLESLDN